MLKIPPYKVTRAGHYPMIYDRITGIPWPCDPFDEKPKDPDAEKDPSYIKLSKCPKDDSKVKRKRSVDNLAFIRSYKLWKQFINGAN